jgi:AhpD family alkylhydroperoxidase
VSGAPRIAPGSRRDVGLVTWGVARIAGRAAGSSPPNLFLTLGRHHGLFRGWLWFAGRLMPGGKLPRRETELVILRVAHLRDCSYEFDHHVRLGRRVGLDDEDLRRIVEGPVADGWSTRERALVTAIDELHNDRDITDETWRALRAQLDERELIELIFLAGHYEMLATFLNTVRVQPDAAGPD